MKRIFLVLAMAMLMALSAGCAKKVYKEWVPETGSRSDATVTMALFWNPNTEIPDADKNQALWAASERCKSWGYAGAEPFGSMQTKCTNKEYTGFGWQCTQMTATAVYQCTGNSLPAPARITPPKKAIAK